LSPARDRNRRREWSPPRYDILEHGLGEGFAVRREAAHIRIEIECTVGGKDRGEAGPRQLFEQDGAVSRIVPLDLFELVDAVESAERRFLRDGGGRDIEM